MGFGTRSDATGIGTRNFLGTGTDAKGVGTGSFLDAGTDAKGVTTSNFSGTGADAKGVGTSDVMGIVTEPDTVVYHGIRISNVMAGNETLDKLVSDVVGLISCLFPRGEVSALEVQGVVESAWRAADDNYGESEAIKWGGDFVFPAGMGDRDADRLRELEGDLAALTSERHSQMSEVGRLSAESIRATVDPLDPDFELLLSLVDGIPVVTAADFEPNEHPPPLRAKYLRVSSAVNKMVFELFQKGLIFILPTATALTIPGIHFSSTHWALKKGKRQGRLIGDGSSEEWGHPLNGIEVKRLVDGMWGPIKHPTIDSLVGMVCRVAERVGWNNVVLWKIDLKGAFTLLFIRPEDVRLLAFELTNGLTMLYHTGMFGHTEMPCGFDIITRVLRRTIGKAIHANSECDVYVDDVMGASAIQEVHSDMAIATEKCDSLLGPVSVEPSKSSWGRRLDIIGWSICLDSRTVSIAKHNFYKALYGFFTVDENEAVPVRVLQKLASWASRYSSVSRFMRPFTTDLYRAMGGTNRKNSSRHLDDDAKFCVRLWRCCLCLMELKSNKEFSRSMHSYLPQSSKYLVEFDGSLTGVGMVLYRMCLGATVLWKVARFVFPFDLAGDSSYQNTCEFIAITLATGCLIKLGVHHVAVSARGDSTTALTWAVTERFRSGPSSNSTMCFVILGIEYGIHFEEMEHIRGVDNVLCDKLSRHHSPEQLGFEKDQIMVIDGTLLRLMDACNPLIPRAGRFEEAWASVSAISSDLGDTNVEA